MVFLFIKDCFAGVNSPGGFFSYFNYISDDIKEKKKLYIKGGSGMGKSSFMKRVAQKAEAKGLDVERFHCSSDPTSLDGLSIPAIGVSVVDATLPHISDPAYPGYGGEIVDFPEFMIKEYSPKKMNEIQKNTLIKKECFSAGYRYLAAAQKLVAFDALSYDKAFLEAQTIVKRFLKENKSCKTGAERKLFVSAVCPGGVQSYHETNFSSAHKVAVAGEIAHKVLNILKDFAKSSGYDTVCFYCPVFPGKFCDHIFIPGINTVFSAQNTLHNYSGDETVDLTYHNTFKSDTKSINMLINSAVSCFEKARAAHLEIEKINIPQMYFERLDKRCGEIIERIFA